MNASGISRCAVCNAALPIGLPRALCPQCALKGALEAGAIGTPQLLPGSFGDYELLEEIARGGMGVVYKARQKSLDRIVAVKMLLSGSFASDELIRRFKVEATSTASLRHPNIVAVHEVGCRDGQHFLVMDYVDGPNLSILVRDQPLPPKLAATFVKIIAEAIHYAHEKDILHRDLKPSNILVDSNDQPHVTDFGLARHIDGESSLTLSGQVLGSLNYMPPEQAAALHQKVSRQSDVYGLGAILYHLLTGRPPFEGGTMAETVQQVMNAEPTAPRAVNPAIPRDVETICLKCLEKEPEERYQTADELRDELDRFVKDEPIQAVPVHAFERFVRWCQRKPVVASLAAMVVVTALAGITGWMVALRESDDPAFHVAKGEILRRSGRMEEAHSAFSKAIELSVHDDERRDALLRRSEVLRQLRRWAEAGIDDRRVRGLPFEHFSLDSLPDFHRADFVSIEFGSANQEAGLYFIESEESRHAPATIDGEEAWFFEPGSNHVHFFIDPTFKWSLHPNSNVVVKVYCRTASGQAPSLHYDGVKDPYSVPFRSTQRGSTSQWEVFDFVMRGTRFENSQRGGADLRLSCSNAGFYLKRVTLSSYGYARTNYARLTFAPRDPSLSSNLIDLTAFYNSYYRSLQRGGDTNALARIMDSIWNKTGVQFECRGFVAVYGRGEDADATRVAPASVTGIPVERQLTRLHFLQSAIYGERDGTKIGWYVAHMADGSRYEIPIIYGEHVRSGGDKRPTVKAELVFGEPRLFKMTWFNPLPEVEVESLDFISALTASGPYLFAITVE